ncbi:MAG: DUF2219 family protein [Paracoccaceae bacterium]|nr:DUF2219 family protein [Paracoccaceae bacterium]
MIRFLCAALVAAFALGTPALSQERETLGYGRLVNNDSFGDVRDRWQTGSVSSSRVRGYGWDGMLPERAFSLIEYRVGSQLVAPDNLRQPAAGDRPYGGAISLGVHTHFARGMTEFAAGLDLVFTGPQTGLGEFQTAVHDAFGMKPPARAVLANQIGNAVHPTFVGEAGSSLTLGGRTVLRPFAELRWGVETLARVGADLTIGSVGQGELLIRDAVTGQRYRAVHERVPGFSYVVGGDIAYVDESAFLPADRGFALTDSRSRLRAGVHWQGEKNAAFYGVTYLSEEFQAQPEGQVVGSFRLQLRF